MDKRRATEIITEVYRTLTPKKVSVFNKNEDVINVRVISESFQGMAFSNRFKLLNDKLQADQPDLFKNYLFIFEAFTSAELQALPKDQQNLVESTVDEFKSSAKPLEP